MICDSLLFEGREKERKNRRYTWYHDVGLSWLAGWINSTRMLVCSFSCLADACRANMTSHIMCGLWISHILYMQTRGNGKEQQKIQIIIFLPPLWFHYYTILSVKKHARSQRVRLSNTDKWMRKKSAGKIGDSKSVQIGTTLKSKPFVWFFYALKN